MGLSNRLKSIFVYLIKSQQLKINFLVLKHIQADKLIMHLNLFIDFRNKDIRRKN